jgi:hypothetical protein
MHTSQQLFLYGENFLALKMSLPPRNLIEYNNIVLFLQGKGNEVRLERQQKARLKKKAEDFLLIDNLLYLRDNTSGIHKKVFHSEQADAMEIECKAYHQIHHYGVNRFEAACNNMFFKIPREVIRKVVSKCLTCAQSEPLKNKEKQVHIVACKPLERLMIDLIDMTRYKASNDSYGWILRIIDVYSKFAWAFPMKNKSGAEVVKNLKLSIL